MCVVSGSVNPCRIGQSVPDPYPHAGVNLEMRNLIGVDPRSLTGLVVVGLRDAVNRRSMETQGELLADFARCRVGHDVSGIAVDTGGPADRDRDAGLFRDFTRGGLRGGLPNFDTTAGQFPISAVARRIRSTRPRLSRAITKAVGLNEFAGGTVV